MVYDVVVVGSGPAGSSAAAVLARGGREVLLVDREVFPRDKACGDLIGPRAFGVLEQLGVAAQVRAGGFYPLERARLWAPGGGALEIDFRRRGTPFGMIARRSLDALLRQHALGCGADYMRLHVRRVEPFDGTRVHLHGEAAGEPVRLAARAVIGADGASSLVARALGWPQPAHAHRGVAIRGYARSRGPTSGSAELSFLRGILPGYAWSFPADDWTVNLGVGIRTDHFRRSGASLRGLLEQFLALPAVRERVEPDSLAEVSSWSLNLGSHPGSRVFDGALLVGDAGAFVDPLVGAGIHTALITGQIAAEVLLAALATGDLTRRGLAAFDRRWRQCLEQDFRVEQLVQQAVTAMPALIDLAALALPGDSELVRFFVKKV